MKTIGYHYIRKFDPSFPFQDGIRFLDIDSFRKQLDLLQKEHTFPTREEFLGYVRHQEPLPENSLVLSFDDGTRDHYEYVFPELLSRDLWGIFFIPVRHIVHGLPNFTFVLHHLIGRVGVNSILLHALDYIESKLSGQEEFDIEAYNKAYAETRQADHAAQIVALKRLINSKLFFRTERSKDGLMQDMIREFFPDFNLSSIYMTNEQLRILQQNGMLLGGHSVTHNYMRDLSSEEQRNEIGTTFEILDTITGGLPARIFAYPYGGLDTINLNTFEALQENAVDSAFTFEASQEDQSPEHQKYRQYLWPRISCSKFQLSLS